ncbi:MULTISPECIES: TolC family protein [Pelosinus]|uniref:Outer membrane efflux protein n=1 Tax=Pelosinus fermentans B4 TaxID=1149862 RepID=I8RAM3_9FIRM|nr:MULTISPECIES: TolC family protein [Pelosinus]EIW15968.1 outer membrane efflux protein [Pelosinus fermentans B4]EIW27326.1 outer membrane efflux protein [Pelosinus fermentans A11]
MLKQTHWKKQLMAALTGGFLILNTVSAFAAPIELSLEESIARALQNNPAIKIADADRQGAEYDIRVAKGGKLPTLKLEHSDGRSKTYVNDTASIGNQFGSSVTLGMNLYTGGEVEGNIEKAKIGLKVADLDVEKSKQQIKLDATNGFFTILQTRNTVKVDQESVDQMAAHLKNVEAQYNVGTVAKSDVLRSQVELANNQQILTKAENAYEIAVSNLNNVMGLPLDTEIQIKDELVHEPYNLSLEDSLNYAMSNRPEAIQADHNIEIAKQSVKIAKAGKLPTVAASASQRWADDDFPGTDENGWSVGLTATWTPFDSGVTNAQIKKSNSEVEKSLQTAKQTKDAVQLEVRQAYLNMIEAEKRISTSQVTVEQAEEDFKIAQVRYSAGVGTNTDVIDAQVALTQAKNNYIQAMYDFNTSKANLTKAMGVPIETVQ